MCRIVAGLFIVGSRQQERLMMYTLHKAWSDAKSDARFLQALAGEKPMKKRASGIGHRMKKVEDKIFNRRKIMKLTTANQKRNYLYEIRDDLRTISESMRASSEGYPFFSMVCTRFRNILRKYIDKQLTQKDGRISLIFDASKRQGLMVRGWYDQSSPQMRALDPTHRNPGSEYLADGLRYSFIDTVLITLIFERNSFLEGIGKRPDELDPKDRKNLEVRITNLNSERTQCMNQRSHASVEMSKTGMPDYAVQDMER